jgi:uncharacterized membrane protein (GlpM family)
MDIIARATLSGVLVAVVLVVARSDRTQAAGLFVLFPVVTLLSYYFVGSSEGPERLAQVVKSSLLAFPIWFVFAGTTYALLPLVDFRIALTAAMAAWLIVGGVYLLLVRT